MTEHTIDVRRAAPSDRAFIRAALDRSWGGPLMAVHGELIDATSLSALIAWRDDAASGLLTYRVAPTEASWEIVSLDAIVPGVGIGSALVHTLLTYARETSAQRVWLVTTNDNTDALRFYQRRGFDIVALHRDAVTSARRLKPSIPTQANGIDVRHELELEIKLNRVKP